MFGGLDLVSATRTKLFPYYNKTVVSYKLVFEQGFDEIDYLLDHTDEGEFLKNNFIYCGDSRGGLRFRRYKGKFYIVKNAYDRGKNEHGAEQGWYCEDVYGYLHLIISINESEESGGHQPTEIYISALKT